ncbi:MAG: alternative ribosome rescue aminoacyl-tRNA hydrolase ArfB [Acidocella sp.]|nr:alternative ribosome rescue aminoacyl-tRNA hydrolase ArfB [Acidocella sp.]
MFIQITPRFGIDDSELSESFIAASGPGGQNVNKVATAVQLRFSLLHNQTLPDGVKARLQTLAGRRLTQGGEIVITANRFRTQMQNRADAQARLFEMIRAASIVPVFRKPTRPTKASKTRRLDAKAARSATKRLRRVED